MSKISKRVLSLVLSVLMIVSMVSVFSIPTVATGTETADPYDTAFETAFIINKNWTDEQLAGSDDLTIWFRGEDKTVNPTTHNLFNSYDDAYAVAYADGKVTVENYFTYMPTFIFGPGDYSADGQIHLPTPANVWGAHAGISPNADVAKENRTIEWIKENGGWPANTARVAANETKLGMVTLTTRPLNTSTNLWNRETDLTNDDVKYQYLFDQALIANPDASVDYFVDGITIGGTISLTTLNNGVSYTYNDATYKVNTAGRDSVIHVNNALTAKTSGLIEAWNSTYFYQDFYFKNFRSTANITDLASRFIDEVTFEDSYFTALAGSDDKNVGLFGAWLGETGARHASATLNLVDSVMYSCTASPLSINTAKLHATVDIINLNVTGNLIYNAYNSDWGIARFNNTDATKTINATFTGNTIYNDLKGNTLFNGNTKYITDGKTNIKFNGNRVIGTNSAIPPNSAYNLTSTTTLDGVTAKPGNDIINYDFSGNFWPGTGKTKNDIGIMMKFAAAPIGGVENCTWESGWDWTDSDYYYDFDLVYNAYGTKIASVDAKDYGTAAVSDNNIVIEAPTGEGTLDASSFVTANELAKVAISTTADFAETVDTIDLSAVDGAATYYVKTYYDVDLCRDASTRVYTVNVYETKPVDFNAEIADGSVDLYGKTFSTANTAFYPGDSVAVYTDSTVTYFYEWLDGTFYKFTVDNVNVFDYASSTQYHYARPNDTARRYSNTSADFTAAKAVAENGNIILIGDFAKGMHISYPATFVGSNMGIDPVDKTNATAANSYTCALNSAWDENGTTVGPAGIVADIAGLVRLDGITLANHFFDANRSGTSTDVATIEIENVVVDMAKVSNVDAIFLMRNARNINNTASETLAEYKDQTTLKNIYIKKAATNQIVDEWSAPVLTLDNIYCDITASTRKRDLIAYFKGGRYNKYFDVTVKNCILTNGKSDNYVVSYDGYNDKTNFTADDGRDFKLTVENNIFYKVGNNNSVGIASGALNELTIKNNLFVAKDSYSASATGFIFNVNNSNGGRDVVLAGNMDISNNRFVGFGAFSNDIGMEENNPVIANSFVSSGYEALTDTDGFYGEYTDAAGDGVWYLDYDMTAVASDYYIASMTSANEKITDIVIDNKYGKISVDLYDGSTDEIAVELANEGATYYWSTDASGTQKIDTIKNADLTDPVNTFYFNVSLNNKVRTYEATVVAYDALVFTKDYSFAEGMFDSSAVLVTDKAANIATGTAIYDSWEGKIYEFTAGVNAVAALEDTTAEQVLIKEWGANVNFTPTRSVKLYTQNYNTNPVKNDGLGNASPTQGKGWGYNEAYDTYSTPIGKIVISSDYTGTLEMYGFTFASRVEDYRTYDMAANLKFVNTSVTGEAGYTAGANKNGERWYIFYTTPSSRLVNQDNTDKLEVVNMYVNIPTTEESPKYARLIGEPTYATTTFDGLYVDAAVSAFDEHGCYIKSSASNSSFTIKNSCLLNLSGSGWQFEGRRVPAEGYDDSTSDNYKKYTGSQQDIPEGDTNTITLENNIITGALGGNQSSDNTRPLLYVYINGYSGVTIKDNYLASLKESTGSLFWAYGLNKEGGNEDKCDIVVTGNTLNGYARSAITLQCSEETGISPNYNWTVKDNFHILTYTEDVAKAVGIRSKFMMREVVTYDGTRGNLADGFTFKLDAAGTLSTATIYDFEWAEKCTGDEGVVYIPFDVANGTVAYDEETGYTYTVNLKDATVNTYDNYMTVTANDTTYAITDDITFTSTEALTSFPVTLNVSSPDGTADAVTYNVTVNYHNIEKVPATATCTEAGHKEYFTCAVCNANYTDAQGLNAIADLAAWTAEDGEGYLAALGHDMTVPVEAKAPTCTEDGYTAHTKCSRCDYTEGKEAVAACHDEVPHDGKTPTCTEIGWDAYVTCSRCDYTTYVEKAATGHLALAPVAGIEPNYTTAGHKGYWYCADCDTYFADEEATQVIEDIEAWKTGDGKLDVLATPELAQGEDNNTATLTAGGDVKRVYWGYIGTVNTTYKWFADFKAECGDTFKAEYAPKNGDEYALTKVGFYRFVVVYIDDDGKQVEDVYTYEVTAAANTVPEVAANEQFAELTANGVTLNKVYWGYIGETKTAYDWSSFKAAAGDTFKADFGPKDGKKYRMTTEGYYRFVVVYTDANGRTCEVVYTVACGETAPANAGTPVVTVENNRATLDYNDATVNKMYIGYFGVKEVEVDTWAEYKEGVQVNLGIASPADGFCRELASTGCYVVIVNYTDENGKAHDVYYTFMVEQAAE